MKKMALFSLMVCGIFVITDCLAETICNGKTCRQYNIGGSAESRLCTNLNVGDDCTSGKPGATRAVCVSWNSVDKSCAARECDDNHILWLTNTRSNPSIQSQGRCMERSWLENFCNEGCGCDSDEKCVLNEIDFKVTDRSYTVKGFVGEEACVCKKMSCSERYFGNESAIACCNAGKQWDAVNNTCKCADGEEWKKVDNAWKCVAKTQPGTVVEDDCKYMLSVDIVCPDGTRFRKNQKLTEDQAKGLSCGEFESLMGSATSKSITTIDFVKGLTAEIDAYKELLQTICKDHLKKAVDVDAAKKTLKSFFANAKENASVWKTESGNFNGTRLASDLTAGVVLGTVGGVVSANVIKKNQIKKGYEVLHCTIGGQTVADWGDTFNTGLRG